MKLYSSFLIRCWLLGDAPQAERSLLDVEHVQTGDRTRVTSLAEAEEWMFAACRAMQASAEAGREAGQERALR